MNVVQENLVKKIDVYASELSQDEENEIMK